MLAEVAGLDAELAQYGDGRREGLDLGTCLAAGDVAVDAGQVEAELLLEAGEAHGKLGADDAPVHAPAERHEPFELGGILVAAPGEKHRLRPLRQPQTVRPAGALLLGDAKDVLVGPDVVSEVGEAGRH